MASYALDGHECAHNIAYWTGQGYLGLGRSAAGMLDAEDFDRLAGLFPDVLARGDAYRVRLVQRDDAATTFDAEYLSQREAAAEDLMLACRMTRGIGPDLLFARSVIAADGVGGRPATVRSSWALPPGCPIILKDMRGASPRKTLSQVASVLV